MLDTKRAFAARWGHSLGTSRPAVGGWPIRRDQAVPAFANCSLDDMVGDGDQWGGAGGGTIGSGDPTGQFNDFLRWGLTDIVDEPNRLEVIVWLDKGARRPRCTVDLTPRRCRKFKPAPARKFKWTSADEAGKVLQSGSTAADRSRLVTVKGLIVTKEKRRVSIVGQ